MVPAAMVRQWPAFTQVSPTTLTVPYQVVVSISPNSSRTDWKSTVRVVESI